MAQPAISKLLGTCLGHWVHAAGAGPSLVRQELAGSLSHTSMPSARLHNLLARSWGIMPRPAGGMAHMATATAAAAAAATAAAVRQPKRVSWLTNLKQLSKFRLSSLVVLTASAGYVLGSGDSIDLEGLLWTSLGTFGAAACANTLNQVYEVANDSRMSRTCNRPLPAGRMTRAQALVFAAAAGAMGLATLYYKTDELTTALGAANIALYAGIYTPLKQLSIANTWVGALVGAIPPLMGWSAAAGGQLDAGALVLAGALFCWQLPHFLALAWLCKDDYLRGGFRMISAVDPTGRRTALAALRNSVYLLPLGLAAYYAGVTTQPFAWEAAALAAMLCVPAARFLRDPTQQAARKLFRASLLYLPLLLAGAVVHRQPNTHQLTLGELQAQLQAAVSDRLAGPAETSILAQGHAHLERVLLAAQRVLGLGRGKLLELRCPSAVHSDDGRSSSSTAAGRSSPLDGMQPADAGLAPGPVLPPQRQPVTVYYSGGRIVFVPTPGRHVEWPDMIQPGGSWRDGVVGPAHVGLEQPPAPVPAR